MPVKKMRLSRPLSIVIVCTLAMVAGVHAETINAEYDVPSGPSGNQPDNTQSSRFCAPEWREWNEGLMSDGQDSALFGDSDDNPDDTYVRPALQLAMGTSCGILDPLNGDEDDGFVRIGVGRPDLRSTCGDCYSDFAITVTDIAPAHTFFVFCIITDYQDGRDLTDSVCGEDPRRPPPTYPPDDTEDPRVAACGSATLTSSVAAGGTENAPSGIIYATYVDASTGNVCLGAKGTMTVTMS